MTPSTPGSSAGAAPLPPLPNLTGQGAGGGTQGAAPGGGDPMAALVSGIAPIKMGVDQIVSACQQIVQSGAVPGSEQVCGQIVALATSLLPMAAQQMMGPGQGASGIPPIGPPPQPGL